MLRSRTLFTLSATALALAALTGCAASSDAPAETEDAAAAQPAGSSAGDPAESAGDGGSVTLDGEGIAYGAESITGVDFDVTCMGAGDELTLTGTGVDAEGSTHSVAFATGSFSYATLSEDMTTSAVSLIAGTEMPGTEVTVESADGAVTISGTASAVASDGSSETVPFISNLTCDTSL